MNIMKKDKEPVVEQSLEATRNIEFQLLNMKKELERVYSKEDSDVNMTPAVSETLDTLRQIDEQLQNMYAVLEDYTNLIRESDSKDPEALERHISANRPTPPPTPFRGPPSFPTQQPRYTDEPWYSEHEGPYYNYREDQYYPYPPDHYLDRFDMQERYDRYYYDDYYDHERYGPRYYRHSPYSDQDRGMYYAPHYPAPYPKPYPTPYPRPYGEQQSNAQDYPPMFNRGEYGYYNSQKYPTSSTPQQAYNRGFRAVPKRMFKVAYYPWQQLTGDKNPVNSRVPYMNLYDLGSEYMVYVELPGVEKDNLELRVDDQAIWINGKPTIIGGEDGQPVIQEHGFHEFYRQVPLPSKVISSKTTCVFENGILKIKLIKYNPRKSARKVKIK